MAEPNVGLISYGKHRVAGAAIGLLRLHGYAELALRGYNTSLETPSTPRRIFNSLILEPLVLLFSGLKKRLKKSRLLNNF